MLALYAVLAQEPSVDQILVETAAMLEKCGISIPAGARYCEAEVSFDGKRPDRPMRAKGWQLPAGKGSAPKFLALNGTVVHLLSVVKPADLRSDIAQNFELGWFSNSMVRGFSDTAYVPLQDLTVALCYMAGQRDLAKQCLRRRQDNGGLFPIGAVSPVLADKLSHVIGSFAGGNDRVANTGAKWIVERRADFESSAIKATQGVRLVQAAAPTRSQTAFPFLDTANLILTDTKRRLADKRPKLSLEEIQKLPVTEQALALIDQLEEARVYQMSYPGAPSYWEEPRVKALAKLGDAAVGPLLDCLEKDDRLTRSYAMSRPYSLERRVIPVRELARKALEIVTQTGSYPTSESVPALRARWEAIKSFSPEERNFEVLLDDAAKPHSWIQAARYLLSPVTREFFGPGTYRDADPVAAQSAPLRAQALPNAKRLATSDLIVKRLVQIGENNFAGELLQMLSKWDPPAAQAAIRATFDRWMKDVKLPEQAWIRGPEYALLVRMLVDAGDKSILSDYVAWLKRLEPNAASSMNAAMLQPLVAYSEQPAVRGVMTELLGAPSGPFNLALLMDKHPTASYALYFKSPLLKLPEVRRAAIEVLRNRRSYGECTVKQGIVFLPNSTGSEGPGIVPAEYEGKSTMVRICDRLATELTWGPNMIHSYWPLAQRDEAIEKLIKQLESNTFPVPTKWPMDSGNLLSR